MMSFLFYTTISLFIFVCFCMILLILIQKGRGGGLASAFGGAGGNTAFGSKTGDVLTWATSVVFGVFLLLAVALNKFADARNENAKVAQASVSEPASGAGATVPLEVPVRSSPAPGAQLPAALTTPPITVPSTAPAGTPATVPAAAAPKESSPTSAPASAPPTPRPAASATQTAPPPAPAPKTDAQTPPAQTPPAPADEKK
jgi:preprotein translocase subunit SecG